MELSEQLARARARAEELRQKKQAAWDLAPGNFHPQHVYRTAQGYHQAWNEWRAAQTAVQLLEGLIAAQKKEAR